MEDRSSGHMTDAGDYENWPYEPARI